MGAVLGDTALAVRRTAEALRDDLVQPRTNDPVQF